MPNIQPIEVLLPLLKKVKKSTSEDGKWTSLCPAHDDKRPSLSISTDNEGKIALHCHVGCTPQNILSAIDLKMANLFPKNQNITQKKAKLTLAELAKEKQIPEAFLKELGVFEKGYSIQITYYLEDGSLASRQRLRKALKAGDGSLWQKGNGNPVLYGLWKLGEARATKTLVLVEGESDCWSLWFHGFQALGFPGADMTAKLEENFLKGIETLYILNEKDKGGETFVQGLANRLKKLKWSGKAFIVTLPDGIKDPNELLKAFPQNFKTHFQKALEQSIPLEQVKYSLKQTTHSVEESSSLQLLGIGHKSENLIVPEKGWLIPEGWEVDNQGIYRLTQTQEGEEKRQRIAHSPAIVSARSVNIDSNYEQLEVSFARDLSLQKIWVDRHDLLNHRSLVILANQGFPVTSRNSAQLVDYLSDFEANNLHHLAVLNTVSSFGWKKHKGELFFVLGNQPIGTSRKILFLPDGEGEKNFAKALKTKGSLEDWLKIIKKILPFPKALFALYAGFAPPLLSLLDLSSFSIDFCGDSSIGKTTTIMIPASIYGDPVGDRGGIIPSWNATSVSIERYASLFKSLPIFLDDSHLATVEQVKSVIYMLSGGIGKMRGAIKGAQSLAAWHTIGFFTGERPVISVTTHEGARARVIELQGSPFPLASGQFVSDLKIGLGSHFGHAGPLFLQHLIQLLRDKSDNLKSKTDLHSKMLKNLAPSGIDNRRASYFSAIWTAAELVEDLFNIGGEPNILIPKLFEEVCGEGSSFAQKAMESISSWVTGNWNNFDTGKGAVVGEMYGVIQTGEYVAILPHKLEDFLIKKGYSYEAVTRSFRDKEWIQTDGKNIAVKMSYHGTRSRMIKVFWKYISL